MSPTELQSSFGDEVYLSFTCTLCIHAMLRCVICMVHYLFFILRFMIFSTQIAFFTGLLFASIAVIPKIDVGLDQELALPKVSEIKKKLESHIIH